MSEIPREVVLWGSCRPSQPSHAAPAAIPANLLWQCVSALSSCLWHRDPPLLGASPCLQVSGNTAGSSGRTVQVPRWVKLLVGWRERMFFKVGDEDRSVTHLHQFLVTTSFVCRPPSDLPLQYPSLLWTTSKRQNQPEEETGPCYHVFIEGKRQDTQLKPDM